MISLMVILFANQFKTSETVILVPIIMGLPKRIRDLLRYIFVINHNDFVLYKVNEIIIY